MDSSESEVNKPIPLSEETSTNGTDDNENALQKTSPEILYKSYLTEYY